MTLLIDGYNLLNVSGVFPSGPRGGTLEQAREAFLDWLADSLTSAERRVTIVVFDARQAPPGLPKQFKRRGLQVQFAHRKIEADDLIEELIRADSSPRQMTVVSSDHRLQRAAKRRRATAIDSDQWCRNIEQRRRASLPENRGKLEQSPDQAEVERWVNTFQIDEADLVDETPSPEHFRTTPSPHEDSSAGNEPDESSSDPSSISGGDLEFEEGTTDEDLRNPFPPGYGEDLLDDSDS